MKKIIKKAEEAAGPEIEAVAITETGEAVVPAKKPRLRVLRAAIVAVAAFTIICGVLYPFAVTLAGQTLFPWQSNGSQLAVVNADGSEQVIGSELIGQRYEDGIHLFGRVNTGTSNLNPNSEEFRKLVEERRDKLIAAGLFAETDEIPDELLTNSGSGCDPHISPRVARMQAAHIAELRNERGWRLLVTDGGTEVLAPERAAVTENASPFTEEFVSGVIDRYTEGRFLGIFGEERVNVLKVNITLDGLTFKQLSALGDLAVARFGVSAGGKALWNGES